VNRHLDLAATQIDADYSPSEREAEWITAAFATRAEPRALSDPASL
jgi:hypothetical protein